LENLMIFSLQIFLLNICSLNTCSSPLINACWNFSRRAARFCPTPHFADKSPDLAALRLLSLVHPQTRTAHCRKFALSAQQAEGLIWKEGTRFSCRSIIGICSRIR
jgi:hypothetical protein